ncbi:hypothetical protein [Novosphingobium sp. PASSN1]|uniref:hypothetical protein n=1 Tax=Novosphingobium sp. PASSN1 TaxID=2015561 RepID=UPI000BD65043|nr:hypothetical protein [Novosphingobium sp. PASSN1]OYU37054.1 MAG: hypothetical protein CFE35_01340 [Novosphingobium sp. PASSN1]
MADLTPQSMIAMPMARAALLQHGTDESGARQLTLYHLGKEVSWDVPRHFAFAEVLVTERVLSAGDAAQQGGLDWAEAADMLGALLEEGLLVRADPGHVPAHHALGPVPSPLPPAPMDRPRTWTEAPSLMAELTGMALDPAYLEVVVPVFRTAHLFRDADGRPIGEANVFPAAARHEVPTEWRGCPYPGNRFQADKPINMTALKAMRAQWRQMMGLLLPIRAAYLARFPEAAQGWTVGHVERLAVCVLALPSYILLRRDAPVADGALHPALSNLFRVTDGLRMVMHHMMFVPLYERMRGADAPVSAESILAYADRNYLFHSDHGVCAGPRFMIEDFLGVILDGAAPRSGFDPACEPELAAAAGLIAPAMNYGLLGLQTFGAVFSLWPAMARCYARLHTVLGDAGVDTGPAAALAERFAGHFAALSHRSFLGSEAWRSHREAVYDDMFAACARGLGDPAPAAPLSAEINAPAARQAAGPRTVLEQAAAEHFGPDSGPLAAEFAAIVMDFLGRAQRIIARAEAVQARIAALLHRPVPAHRLTLAQINLHNVLMGQDMRSVPFLPDEFAALLGIRISVDARTIAIVRGTAPTPPHSPAAGPVNTRA